MNVSLDIYLEAIDKPVGRLTGDNGTMEFGYLRNDAPISMSLPVREEAYGDASARAFFANLLFENEQRDQIMAKYGIDNDDIAGLLFYLGKDCPGAISCVPKGEAPAKRPGDLDVDYVPVGDLAALMKGLERRRLPEDLPDPSPLAGVQGKVAVAVIGDRIMFPVNGAPTTHILKVPRAYERSLVQNEHSLLHIARKVQGHPVAQARILEIGEMRGLLIERYDRYVANDMVYRIHQEDFCQALGLHPRLKYERDGIEGRRFDAHAIGSILDQTDAPAVARRAFFIGTMLNIALGNSDNHAKNYSLLYDIGSQPTLAPFYDIVPVMMDRDVNHDFSFNIGNAERLEDLRPEDLSLFAIAIGYRRLPGSITRDMVKVLQSAADRIDDLQGPGFKGLGDALSDQMRMMSENLALDLRVPMRDLFIRD